MSITNDTVRLTVGGVVQFAHGYMHPEAFRALMGELAWEEVLARPRVVCEYDYEEEINAT